MAAARSWFRIAGPRAPLILMTSVFFLLGATLWLQPGAYHNTPSYANLLDLVPTWGWGCAYLLAAALGLTTLIDTVRWLMLVTHVYGILLLLVWWFAFLVRWITDGWITTGGTTIVNVLSWGVFICVMTASLDKLGDRVAEDTVT
jgi:hypothetical protein